jgi:enoyl-CoA hydratase/carnithine racemase
MDGAIRRVTLNRPEKRNALTREMYGQLLEAFQSESHRTERVTVISAEGPVFCAGNDLHERLELGSPPLGTLCKLMNDYPAPIVAAVQGDAIAAGAFFALASDVVIAAAGARFWFNAARLGLAPPLPLVQRLLQVTGMSLCKELLLIGEPVEAGRLSQAHAIYSAVALDQVTIETERVVDRLARSAPPSLRAIKAAINLPLLTEDNLQVAKLIEEVTVSNNGLEGVRAQIKKRDPNFIDD